MTSVDDNLVLEKSSAVDLLLLSDFLLMKELHNATREFLIQNLTQAEINTLKLNAHPVLADFLETIPSSCSEE